jgi:hypothetical protein
MQLQPHMKSERAGTNINTALPHSFTSTCSLQLLSTAFPSFCC